MELGIPALVSEFATQYRFDADLFAAQIQQESSGDPWAFRFEPAFFRRYIRDNPQARTPPEYGPLAACSYGLMQIMLETACSIGFAMRPEQLFVPEVNLEYGSTYLRQLLDRYHGDVQKALAAYNGGPGAVVNGPPYRTQDYVNAVYRRANRLGEVRNA
jgi:soluble lytic murein transglycosylase-like protein